VLCIPTRLWAWACTGTRPAENAWTCSLWLSGGSCCFARAAELKLFLNKTLHVRLTEEHALDMALVRRRP
jgi:hypothetical protein